jgi:ATP-binding cassette subfamily F protein 3
VGDGAVQPFDGDLAAYRKLLLDRAREERRGAKPEKSGDAGLRKADRKAAADLRAQLAPLRKAAQTAEKALADLHKLQAELETRLADPSLYQGPPARLTELRRQQGDLARKVEAAELAWLEAAETLEKAQG